MTAKITQLRYRRIPRQRSRFVGMDPDPSSAHGVSTPERLSMVVTELDELTLCDRDALLAWFLSVAWPSRCAQDG